MRETEETNLVLPYGAKTVWAKTRTGEKQRVIAVIQEGKDDGKIIFLDNISGLLPDMWVLVVLTKEFTNFCHGTIPPFQKNSAGETLVCGMPAYFANDLATAKKLHKERTAAAVCIT